MNLVWADDFPGGDRHARFEAAAEALLPRGGGFVGERRALGDGRPLYHCVQTDGTWSRAIHNLLEPKVPPHLVWP